MAQAHLRAPPSACSLARSVSTSPGRQPARRRLLPNLEEEQETPAVTHSHWATLARHMQPTVDRENAIEAVEPIVVEGPAL